MIIPFGWMNGMPGASSLTRRDRAAGPRSLWSRFLASSRNVEIVFQPFFIGKRDRIDAGEHLAVRIAPPVGAGGFQDFKRFDFVEVGQVGAAAKIEKLPLSVGAKSGASSKPSISSHL